MCSAIIHFAGFMFNSQARNAALRPSVSSAEGDWRPVVIPATHIPQDQGSTSRAETSSISSQGRVSRTRWESSDEQRDVVLDAISVEIPEVKPDSEETK
jgi:hypothetical protein